MATPTPSPSPAASRQRRSSATSGRGGRALPRNESFLDDFRDGVRAQLDLPQDLGALPGSPLHRFQPHHLPIVDDFVEDRTPEEALAGVWQRSLREVLEARWQRLEAGA